MRATRIATRAGMASVLSLGALVAAGTPAYAAGTVTCGATISAPGSYSLAASCTGAGIEITASNVTLRLQGRTITSNGAQGSGIRAVDVVNLRLIGPGKVTGFTGYSVDLENVDRSVIQSLTVNTTSYGILLFNSGAGNSDHTSLIGNTVTGGLYGITVENADDNSIISNTVTGAGTGIWIGEATRNTFQSNKVTGNTLGIYIRETAQGNKVLSNTVTGNGVDEWDDNDNCTSNQWRGNRHGTATPTCLG